MEAKRVRHEYQQINHGPADRVFRLLCPVREADWVPGWTYKLIYSNSGLAELGCIFTTPNEDASETTWIVTEYDPASFTIGFVWVNPNLATAQIKIRLDAKTSDETLARIRYTYTGLSERGNREIDQYDEEWFRNKMQSWEAAINHYLETGRKVDSAE